MIPRYTSLLSVTAVLAAVASSASADEPKRPAASAPAAVSPTGPANAEAAEIIKALSAAWPDRPEWLDMYTAILDDEEMGPQYGWFRSAVTQSRYGWDATRKRYDKDGDAKIARNEFPGRDADFARLDLDRDGAVTKDDFDKAAAPVGASPGLMLFSRADRDGNGKVTREEIDRFFKAADTDGHGFLTRSDLEAALPMPSPSRAMSPGDRPNKAMLIRGLFKQEVGSLQPGPKLDETAPDFTLRTNDGKSEVTLSKLVGPKPVVLIFGNFTCGPFRSHAGNFEKLYRRYGDRANFVMVYVREAHPTDGWRMESNDRLGVSTAQPTTYDERVGVAQRCGKLLGLGFPMLVDSIDDAVGARYSGMPGRFYLIDRQGKVAFKNGRGPYGFKHDELEQALVLLLQDEESRASAGGSQAASR
ncbi:transaldolase/EF-hand domain-containing protein [Aquisphaera giovannonii]|uniref:Transaldolase/EF-hand domain-containing protein n=1 Tax=Aquisphaera giovannonii TaxID=406548 RepID=A0A5B9VZJ6_9BACT|nr:deiodinase family protein [Aquisphaera giovannonii]QEH33718.1 transaldolase/EF-hand domain-containing protein [Aquisphaera giovannonii]